MERLELSQSTICALKSQLIANKAQFDAALQSRHQTPVAIASVNPFDGATLPLYHIRNVVKMSIAVPSDDILWTLTILADGDEISDDTFRHDATAEELTIPSVFALPKKARRGVLTYRFKWTSLATSRNLVSRGAPYTFCLRGGAHVYHSQDFYIRPLYI